MTVDPFGGEVRDNRLYGRGACDTKGPMAAYLTAIQRIVEQGLPFDGVLSFAACMGEEDGCHGARYVMRSGVRADAAIVAEPTVLRLINAHKGAFWWRLTVRGRAGHGAEPALGVNAIYRMGQVLLMIKDDLIPTLNQRHDPILGVPTINVGTIKGGQKTNIIPDECVIEIDRRTISGEDPDEILDDFLRRVERLGIPAADLCVEEVQRAFPFITSREEPVVRAMTDALERLGEEVSPTSVNYFSDAGELVAAGIPSIVFGPGDIRHAHTADEHIELDQLERAVPILVETVMRFFK
jgi:acetylornithine deacetylase